MNSKQIALVARANDAVGNVNSLLFGDVSELTDEEATIAWALLDHIAKVASDRKAELRSCLLGMVEERGVESAKGHRHVDVLGGRVTQQQRVARSLNVAQVEALVTRAGLPLTVAGDVKFVPCETKLAALVATGQLSAEEVRACVTEKVTTALVVRKPKSILDLINRGEGGLLRLPR